MMNDEFTTHYLAIHHLSLIIHHFHAAFGKFLLGVKVGPPGSGSKQRFAEGDITLTAMRVFCFLLFVLIQCSVIAQVQSIDFLVGTDVSHRLLTSNDKRNSTIIDSRNSNSLPKICPRVGINITSRVNEKWLLKTGLRFATVGEQKRTTQYVFETDILGLPSTDALLNSRVNNYYLIEVPLISRRNFAGTIKRRQFAEFGLSPAVFFGARYTTYLAGKKTVHYMHVSDFGNLRPQYVQLVASLAYGLEHNLNDRWQLFAQPVARFHLTSMFRTAIKSRSFSLGLETGVRRVLRPRAKVAQ